VDILAYIDKGGIIVYLLIAMSFIGTTIMLMKLITILSIKSKKDTIINKILSQSNKNNFTLDSIKSNISSYVLSLEYGLNSVKIIATTSPLLGLLGTVIGVLDAFEAISKSGLGDPSIFASGISMALITTVAGLIVAIPHYIGYNYIVSSLDHFEQELEKDILNRL
jgi:biopolymer transport protein ExbB